jgi:hypothetical protein
VKLEFGVKGSMSEKMGRIRFNSTDVHEQFLSLLGHLSACILARSTRQAVTRCGTACVRSHDLTARGKKLTHENEGVLGWEIT